MSMRAHLEAVRIYGSIARQNAFWRVVQGARLDDHDVTKLHRDFAVARPPDVAAWVAAWIAARKERP